MSNRLKFIFLVLMTMALGFGFLNRFPGIEDLDFERLHIFLFNLCCGGTILIYHTEGLPYLSGKAFLFFILSLCYALSSFLEIYIPAMVLGLVLAVLVESIRVKIYLWDFRSFFSDKTDVSIKFHHAALLCLSLSLVMSSLVILNEHYFKFFNLGRLTLNTSFLSFSFPLSLVSMSVIFGLMEKGNLGRKGRHIEKLVSLLKNSCFWLINLGVVIFFAFILMEKLNLQIIVATSLFWGVLLIYVLYAHLDINMSDQQKLFFSSGMFFLIGTAITGIFYIILTFAPDYFQGQYRFLMRIHSFLGLYGWNLTGLAVLIRYQDFPLQLNSKKVIAGHWLVVAIFCPLAYYQLAFALPAVLGYSLILSIFFFSKSDRQDLNEWE